MSQQYPQQAQVYVPYQGGSPNYQTQPNTTIYTRVPNNMQQIPSNPNYDIYPQPQPQAQHPQYISQDPFMTQPYYIPSPAGGMPRGQNGDHRVPDSQPSNTPSTSSDQMGMASPHVMYNQMPHEKQVITSMPRLVINEQPKSAFRFRYNCEGSSHGALLGSKSEKGRKSYPSVYIEKYFGCAVVVASLVPAKTDEPHPFSLTGRGVHNGLHITEIRDGTKQGTEVRLKDLSILHVKKQEVQTALMHKYAVESYIQQNGIYNYMKTCEWHSKSTNAGDDDHDESQKSFGASLVTGMRNDEKKALKDRAQKACDQQQLTTVRLCYRAYLFNPQGQMVQEIGPTFSCTITDTKNCPSLKICKIDKCVGSVSGGDTIYLLCDKVSREDIDVIFEEENERQTIWSAKGDFQPSEVHHQVAIVFNTPPYNGPTNAEAIQCCIKLRKPSTNEDSNAVTFTYLPDEMTKAYIGNKRKRILTDPSYLPNKPQSAGIHFNNTANFDQALQLVPGSTLTLGEEFITDPNMHTSLVMSDADLSGFPELFGFQSLGPEVMNDMIGQEGMNGYDKDTPISVMSEGGTRYYTQTTEIDTSRQKVNVVERDGRKSKSNVVEKDGPRRPKVEKEGPKARPNVVEKDGPPSQPKPEKEAATELPDKEAATDTADKETVASDSSEKGEESQTEPESVSEKKKGEEKEKPSTRRHPLKVARDMGQCAQRLMNKEYLAVQKYAHTGDVRNLLQPLIPYFYLHEHKRSDTLLHTALVSDQISALKTMLSLLRVHKQHAKTVVNMTNAYRHTPLHLAVSLDYTEAVRDLLDAGADPFKYDIYGNTAFHMAASRGHTACLALLTGYITKFNQSKRREPYELCSDVYNFDGKAPLHLAIQHENWAQCCDLLLKGGADLNAEEQLDGMTLLHYSVMKDNLPLACYLLSDHAKEIDVDATTHSGDTALYIALVNKRLNIASTLIRSGASVDVPNADGRTAEEVCEETPSLSNFIQECRSARDKPVYASDLYKLQEVQVSELGKNLKGGKWKELAEELKIDSEQFSDSKGEATTLLLRAYEKNGGTISGLIRACEKIRCPEGVSILKKLT